jgi:hypothetical protein
MISLRIILAAVVLATAGAAPAVAIPAPAGERITTLYDGSLGTTPGSQGLSGPFPFASESFSAGATTFSTEPKNGLAAGYSARPNLLPFLDTQGGFTVRLRLQVISEEHAGSDRNGDSIDDRAGFSLIVLDRAKRGLELAFWEGRVWAQADGAAGDGPIFTQAETAALDTTAGLRDYELAFQGETYSLSTDGQPILSGRVRDYTAFVPGPNQLDVYETANFIFLGDNTASARGTVRIAAFALVTPEYRVGLPVVIRNEGTAEQIVRTKNLRDSQNQ